MKLKISISLMTATTIFSSVLPAFANPTYTPPDLSKITNAIISPTKDGTGCDDVPLGHSRHNNNGSHQSSSGSRVSAKGGGGVDVLKIVGVKGSGGKTTHRTRQNANSWNQDSEILHTGKRCSETVKVLGHALTEADNNATERYKIDVKSHTALKMNQQDNKTKLDMMDRKLRSKMFDNPFDWLYQIVFKEYIE